MVDKGGVGVFAVAEISRGERLASGINDEDYNLLIPWERFADYDPALQQKILHFCVGTSEGFIPPEGLDFNMLSIDWYFNHSCDGNLGFDDRGDFVTRKHIMDGEELTYDYGLAESNPSFQMRCTCESKNCRTIITGNDWQNEDFRRQNIQYMLPKLRRVEVDEVAQADRPVDSDAPRQRSGPGVHITSLRGLGKEIWDGQDAQEYVDSERDSWEK